jgi:hypothetical protein
MIIIVPGLSCASLTVLTSINACGNLSRCAAAGHRQRTCQPLFLQRAACPYAAASGAGGGLAELAAQSGRGKRGELTFHVTPESLRNEMMEEALKAGSSITRWSWRSLPRKICGAAASVSGRAVAKRHADAAHSLLPLAGAASAGFLPGRAEQHLAGQVFSADAL